MIMRPVKPIAREVRATAAVGRGSRPRAGREAPARSKEELPWVPAQGGRAGRNRPGRTMGTEGTGGSATEGARAGPEPGFEGFRV